MNTINEEVGPDQDWQSWIRNYSKGQFPSSRPPIKPLALEGPLSRGDASSEEMATRSPSSQSISSTSTSSIHLLPKSSSSPLLANSKLPIETAEDLRAFYAQNHYLPAPKGPFEEERLRTIKRYGLDRPERKKAIDRICRIAKSHFKTNTVIITRKFLSLFSLFLVNFGSVSRKEGGLTN